MSDITTNARTEEQTKEYDGYLVVNWRDDDIRFRKTAPASGRSSPYEVAVPMTLAVNVPTVEVESIEANITIPPAQVEEVVTEAVEVAENGDE